MDVMIQSWSSPWHELQRSLASGIGRDIAQAAAFVRASRQFPVPALPGHS